MSGGERGALWLAVAGKGGSGKSMIAGTLARTLARRGHRVLALDSDPMPGLALSLGIPDPETPPLLDAAERPETDPPSRWRLKPGIGPARAISRFSTPAPDGVRMLQLGKAGPDGLVPINGAVNAYLHVVHGMDRVKSLRRWTVIGDLPAGPRHPAAGFSPYAGLYVVVVEPASQSALTARRIARVVREHRGAEVLFVANKIRGNGDLSLAERLLGEPITLAVPADAAVAGAEREGAAPIDAAPDSEAVSAVAALADALERRTLAT